MRDKLPFVFIAAFVVFAVWYVHTGDAAERRCREAGGVYLHSDWKCVTGIRVIRP